MYDVNYSVLQCSIVFKLQPSKGVKGFGGKCIIIPWEVDASWFVKFPSFHSPNWYHLQMVVSIAMLKAKPTCTPG